jgi:hypothetical protein
MTSMFEPNMNEIFSSRVGEWSFTNDLDGGDISIMRYNNNPYSNFKELPGYDSLPQLVKNKLAGASVYSKSEVAGWNRIDFTTDRAIGMFGAETIYVPPIDTDLLFYKALESWFEGLPYGKEEDGLTSEDNVDISDYKEYGYSKDIFSSLNSIFDK